MRGVRRSGPGGGGCGGGTQDLGGWPAILLGCLPLWSFACDTRVDADLRGCIDNRLEKLFDQVKIVDSTPEYLLFDLISLLLFVCCDFAIGYCGCRSGGELQSLKSIIRGWFSDWFSELQSLKSIIYKHA